MLSRDFRDILSEFSAARVEFLLVGAYALSAHGLVRSTGDLDLWIRNTEENARRTHAALLAFGAPADKISVEDFTRADSVIQVGVPPLRIDILTSISGVAFDEAWAARVMSSVDGLQVPVISRHHLIANKKAAGRPKDDDDVRWLESESK